ncbi:MAG: NUDIX hydrolase [Planctomycetes bacterium]|jgi:ADP-ribose pyrophosphatase|nr:NUDIX hydrolase [Planctomycetota bacterium]
MNKKSNPPFKDKVIYHGQRMDLVLRTSPGNTGRRIVREVVRHPGAVIILPILQDGTIIMIQNLRHTVSERLWELPAGTLEAGEDPGACAARELEEETGYRAAEILPFGWFYTSPGILTEKMYAFVAAGLEPGPQALEENENITVAPVNPAQALTMVRRNEIVDGKTIAVLLKYLTRTKRIGKRVEESLPTRKRMNRKRTV